MGKLMTKVIFLLSCISSGVEFWSKNHTSPNENSELKIFKEIEFFGEISNNWPNDFLEQMHIILLNHADNHC